MTEADRQLAQAISIGLVRIRQGAREIIEWADAIERHLSWLTQTKLDLSEKLPTMEEQIK